MSLTARSLLLPFLLLGLLIHCSVASQDTKIAFLSGCHRRRLVTPSGTIQLSALPSWSELEGLLGSSWMGPRPVSIDSVLQTDKPKFSTERPTFFRERHGWCPYSERVWVTLELKDIEYDTVRIDNTGGPRPSYFAGTTPQMKWPDGRLQGESLDLVKDLDQIYSSGPSLAYDNAQVQDCIAQFRNIFPRRARPSSRAAFLFQGNGDPLWRSTFEETLQGTEDLLSQSEGPFFCGPVLSAADIAWAPFLERYRHQLPCLHDGLEPFHSENFPYLTRWYLAMDRVPSYACRVKGDASSWRKVLTMSGFGNAGVPPEIVSNIDSLTQREASAAESTIDEQLWKEYASTRPYMACTPQAEAGAILTRNRQAIAMDIMKRAGNSPWIKKGLPSTEAELDNSLRALAFVLIDNDNEAKNSMGVGALAGFLDERMCVPRDMGSMSAASIKQLAWELSS